MIPSLTSNSKDGATELLGGWRWMLGLALAAFCVAALLAQAPQTPAAPPRRNSRRRSSS